MSICIKLITELVCRMFTLFYIFVSADGVTYETVQGSVGLSNDTVTAVEWPGERSGETEVPVGGDEDEALSGGTSIMDDEWLEEGDGTWPPIWTREMWLERRAKHHWLSARESRLGCRFRFKTDCSIL